ncbi:MAG: adenylate/guanylate cyclase domain-containing protein [Spirochaetaceae bacterium]
MASSTFDNILKEREIINEKRVAYIRFFLSSLSIFEFLALFKIISFVQVPTKSAIIISTVLFVYATTVLIILLKKMHSKYLKFIVIFFDYLYVLSNFLFDPTITGEPKTIAWYALVGTIVFYLINLLRYSKASTIYAGILSVIIFLSVSIYFNAATDEIISLLFAQIVLLLIGYSITSSNKKMMIEANTKKMMERYLPPQLIGELYKENVSLEPGGKNQHVSILFSDIRSFTSISESMSAAEVVSFLNEYLSAMTDIIFSFKGTIDKFMGDAIMTIFGAPIQGSDDALRAVKTAIAMKKALKEFNSRYQNLKEPLEIGIGINSGNVISGNIGSEKRFDYTVIGDNVNLSSRIEGLTLYYGCPILISGSTYIEISKEDIDSFFVCREVDNVRVKGRTTLVKIYEIMTFENTIEKQLLEDKKNSFERALELYRNSNFIAAIEEFKNLNSDKLSLLYIRRCKEFILNPPDKSWDGTYTMETK